MTSLKAAAGSRPAPPPAVRYARVEPPKNLDVALEGLVKRILKEQPKSEDIYDFAATHFETLLRLRDEDTDVQKDDNFDDDMLHMAKLFVKPSFLAAAVAPAVVTIAQFEKEPVPSATDLEGSEDSSGNVEHVAESAAEALPEENLVEEAKEPEETASVEQSEVEEVRENKVEEVVTAENAAVSESSLVEGDFPEGNSEEGQPKGEDVVSESGNPKEDAEGEEKSDGVVEEVTVPEDADASNEEVVTNVEEKDEVVAGEESESEELSKDSAGEIETTENVERETATEEGDKLAETEQGALEGDEAVVIEAKAPEDSVNTAEDETPRDGVAVESSERNDETTDESVVIETEETSTAVPEEAPGSLETEEKTAEKIDEEISECVEPNIASAVISADAESTAGASEGLEAVETSVEGAIKEAPEEVGQTEALEKFDEESAVEGSPDKIENGSEGAAIGVLLTAGVLEGLKNGENDEANPDGEELKAEGEEVNLGTEGEEENSVTEGKEVESVTEADEAKSATHKEEVKSVTEGEAKSDTAGEELKITTEGEAKSDTAGEELKITTEGEELNSVTEGEEAQSVTEGENVMSVTEGEEVKSVTEDKIENVNFVTDEATPETAIEKIEADPEEKASDDVDGRESKETEPIEGGKDVVETEAVVENEESTISTPAEVNEVEQPLVENATDLEAVIETETVENPDAEQTGKASEENEMITNEGIVSETIATVESTPDLQKTEGFSTVEGEVQESQEQENTVKSIDSVMNNEEAANSQEIDEVNSGVASSEAISRTKEELERDIDSFIELAKSDPLEIKSTDVDTAESVGLETVQEEAAPETDSVLGNKEKEEQIIDGDKTEEKEELNSLDATAEPVSLPQIETQNVELSAEQQDSSNSADQKDSSNSLDQQDSSEELAENQHILTVFIDGERRLSTADKLSMSQEASQDEAESLEKIDEARNESFDVEEIASSAVDSVVLKATAVVAAGADNVSLDSEDLVVAGQSAVVMSKVDSVSLGEDESDVVMADDMHQTLKTESTAETVRNVSDEAVGVPAQSESKDLPRSQDDDAIWGTLEKEMDTAAATIQHSYKAYKNRQRLRREDAFQMTLTSEDNDTDTDSVVVDTRSRLIATGELHDTIIPIED